MNSTVRLQYVSDLHLEARRRWPYVPACASALLLAGDIGSTKKESLGEFLRDVSRRFETVVYTPGNHEFFGALMQDSESALQHLVAQFPNVHYLQNDAVTLDFGGRPVRVVGSTLWAPCPREVRNLRDFRKIFLGHPARRFQPEDMLALYRKNLDYLTTTLHDFDTETVVLTHHAPLLEANGPFVDHPASLSYASDLRHLMLDHVRGWVYGHTHQNLTFVHNRCTVTTNSLGYPGENTAGFRPVALLEF